MRQISGFEVLEAMSRGLGGKPVVEVSFTLPDENDPRSFDLLAHGAEEFLGELGQAAPWLFEWVTIAGRTHRGAPRFAQIVATGHGYVVCRDEATERNPYSGPCRVTVATSTGEDNT